MQKSAIVLQDVFLNQVRKERVAVTIHLLNGFQIKGLIKGFDSYAIVLECDGKQIMVYKHAISTVTPSKSVFFSFSDRSRNNNANNNDEQA